MLVFKPVLGLVSTCICHLITQTFGYQLDLRTTLRNHDQLPGCHLDEGNVNCLQYIVAGLWSERQCSWSVYEGEVPEIPAPSMILGGMRVSLDFHLGTQITVGACWGRHFWRFCLGFQIAQSRSYSYALGPKVGILKIQPS